MASGMSSTKRFLVRLSLVTGSTMATIIGAQSLAMLDTAKGVQTAQQQDAAAVQNTNTRSTFVQAAPPTITILRHSSNGIVSRESVQAAVQPPQAVTIAPPSPVVVSAPVRARTRSSR